MTGGVLLTASLIPVITIFTHPSIGFPKGACRDGTVVRAFASNECGPASKTNPPQKPTSPNSNSTRIEDPSRKPAEGDVASPLNILIYIIDLFIYYFASFAQMAIAAADVKFGDLHSGIIRLAQVR